MDEKMAKEEYHYQFMAEPVTSVAGQLLGVEMKTLLESKGLRTQHPELIINMWDAQAKRKFLYEQLSTIAKQAAWIRQRGIFVSLPLYDEESAVLLSYDNALRAALSALPFVKLALPEKICSVRDEMTGTSNAIWLDDLGKGSADVSGLVACHYEAVKLETTFFNDEVVKPTFTILIKNLKKYCDRIVVQGLENRRYIPVLQEAGIWGVQGTFCRPVSFPKVHTLM